MLQHISMQAGGDASRSVPFTKGLMTKFLPFHLSLSWGLPIINRPLLGEWDKAVYVSVP